MSEELRERLAAVLCDAMCHHESEYHECYGKADRVLASDLLTEVRAEAWNEGRAAPPQYLGPDNGHYADECMGWEDCWCASYINPYRAKKG